MVPELRWQHLPPDVAPDAALHPGVHLLLDEGDDAKHRLLPWLLGLQSPPAPARLHCGNWVCASAAYQAQVCSAPPPSHPPQQCITDYTALICPNRRKSILILYPLRQRMNTTLWPFS